MIKAILFDADNTIYNTSQVAKSGDMVAMVFFSRQTRKPKKSPQELYEDWKTLVGKLKHSRDPKRRSRMYSYSLLAGKYNLLGVSQAYQSCISKVLGHLEIDSTFKRALTQLKDLKLGIITEDSGDQLVSKLRKFGIMGKFSVIITSDQAKTMKPSRIFYELALKNLKLNPEECAVVGDSFEKDLSIPNNMGFITIFFGHEKTEADYAIQNFNQLVKIIRKINSLSS